MRSSDRLLRWIGAALAGAALLIAPQPAQAQVKPQVKPQAPRDCFAAAAPRLVVDRRTVPVALDGQRTIAALSADLEGTGAARALGRAEVEQGLVVEMSFDIEPRNGAYCAVPTEVRLRVEDRRRTIFVAREVTADACLNREVLAHEQRHIRASELVIAAAIADAEAGLRATVRRRPTAPLATAEAATAATRAVVAAWSDALRDRIDTETARRNAEIDSPAEYRRLAGACGRGAAARVAGEAPPRVIATAEGPSVRAAAAAPGRPLTQAPPAPEGPVFRGAVETLDGDLVVRLRPVPERAVVTVTTRAGTPPAREIAELRLTVVRQGNDLVQIRRPVMAARGLAGRWFPDRVVTDALGTLKAIGETTAPAPAGDPTDPLQVFAHELAPRLARALAEIEQPRFPARGVRPGDVINQAAGDDGVVRYDSRMVVRGVATVGGRPVLVVDHSFSIATLGPSLTSRGYRLLDLETGTLRHADANQITARVRAGQTILEPARVITNVVDAAPPR